MSKVWLVTGSASGLGRNIAEAVLSSGDRLVATARDPRRLEDLVEKYGDEVRTAPLDVTDEKAAHAAVQVAVDAFGRLDVVVNNAGYGDVAPFEQLDRAIQGGDRHQFLWCRRRRPASAHNHMPTAKKRVHPSDIICGRSPGRAGQHGVPCRQVGGRRIH